MKFHAQVAIENYHIYFIHDAESLLLIMQFLDKLPVYVINVRNKHLK